MLAIVEYSDNVLNLLKELLGYSPITYTFGEMFFKYKNSVKKSKRNLATEEIFSLSYDSLLSDLKRSIWVSIDKEELPLINKQLKVLEICN